MDSYSALEIINLQVQTLFTFDADGRLLSIREPGYEESKLDPAPRFFMGRTLQGNIWRFHLRLPDAVVCHLEQVCRTEPVGQSISSQSPHNAAVIRSALNEHAPITKEYRGPAYWISESVQPFDEVVFITSVNAHLLEAYFPWMLKPPLGYLLGPVAAVVKEGRAVSICFCSRFTQWAAEAGVETVAAYRGQGYATAVVSGWAHAVRQHGRIALYSTWWENAASLSVARKLRMVLYGEDWSIA